MSITIQQEPTKIEKLEAQLGELDVNNPDKEQKLRQKLRYLQFFQAFQVGPAPGGFRCSGCREVEVGRKVVTYQGCAALTARGECGHVGQPHRRTTVERVVERRCEEEEQHQREWQEQEKGRQEVRQEIRRLFAKEELVGRRRAEEDGRAKARFHQGDFILEPSRAAPAPAPAAPATTAPAAAPAPKELLHGPECKTCVRMDKLTGVVVPHSPNY